MQRAEETSYAEFERLKRELIEPSLCCHEGRLIKTTGDGALVEFASSMAAVRCALEIQDHLASDGSPFSLRVGINLGDVIVGQDGELYGDGINIAVRLEGIADPGGILISEKVYSEVEGKLDIGFEDRGGQQLKNISRPVRAYAVRAGARSALTVIGVARYVDTNGGSNAEAERLVRLQLCAALAIWAASWGSPAAQAEETLNICHGGHPIMVASQKILDVCLNREIHRTRPELTWCAKRG
jgi:hypothetical protein